MAKVCIGKMTKFFGLFYSLTLLTIVCTFKMAFLSAITNLVKKGDQPCFGFSIDNKIVYSDNAFVKGPFRRGKFFVYCIQRIARRSKIQILLDYTIWIFKTLKRIFS